MRVSFDGRLNDAQDVGIVASTNASLFAYVADGSNGLEGDPADLAGEPAGLLRLLAVAPKPGA